MACATPQYTLVGFIDDLDWKPVHFVEPLPQDKQCSVCGLVRNRATHLPCGHVVCHYCYAQCRVADGRACPIDGASFTDVLWKDLPVQDLLKMDVKCWNQEHGCTHVMAASEVTKHFHQECEYHCARCPRCSAKVLCRDMCEHLRASCQALGAPEATRSEEQLSEAARTEMDERRPRSSARTGS
ncbi:hypothetical protein HPB50_001286 [Hyalomma asiaticum]|uniref:Uncharacterized protein n=1 Tax=Hyalomma asiaticum TaxID=266040 RepID=A0ACB7RMQ0_HYAAI|nr:hypothetical protein HPB50_001286 [Hyalomma asiaticum]